MPRVDAVAIPDTGRHEKAWRRRRNKEMLIPIAIDHWISLSGECTRNFTCEMCGEEYGYVHRRTIKVYKDFLSFSWTDRSAFIKLRAKAERTLARALTEEFDMVPCPVCGCVQSPMIQYRRKHELRGLKTFALISMLAGMALGMTLAGLGIRDGVQDRSYFYFAAAVANFGILVAIATWALTRFHLWLTDPNRRFDRSHLHENREPPPR